MTVRKLRVLINLKPLTRTLTRNHYLSEKLKTSYPSCLIEQHRCLWFPAWFLACWIICLRAPSNNSPGFWQALGCVSAYGHRQSCAQKGFEVCWRCSWWQPCFRKEHAMERHVRLLIQTGDNLNRCWKCSVESQMLLGVERSWGLGQLILPEETDPCWLPEDSKMHRHDGNLYIYRDDQVNSITSAHPYLVNTGVYNKE